MTKLDRILACTLVLCGTLIFISSAHATDIVKPENTCVICHSGLSGSTVVGVKSHDWKGSIHQQHGVTCDKCHGGDPQAGEKDAAHVGIIGSTDPKSPVYFKSIPATCGKCHGAEYYKVSQSRHYQMLESSGKGPECATCHGSMVTKVLAPESLAAVCSRCHNERIGVFPYVPQKARAVLLLLRESRELLSADEKLYPHPEGSAAASSLHAARAAVHSAIVDWHRFDLDTITGHLQDFFTAHQQLKTVQPKSEKAQ